MIAIFTHDLVIPYRTKVIDKYLGTLNSPVVLYRLLIYGLLLCVCHYS